jgi:hypothetical protein
LFATRCTLLRTINPPRSDAERISLITRYILGTARLHVRSGLTFISSHLFFKALVGIQPRCKECVLYRSSDSFAGVSSSFLSFALHCHPLLHIEPSESLITIHSLMPHATATMSSPQTPKHYAILPVPRNLIPPPRDSPPKQHILWIGCSDSLVLETECLEVNRDEIFVHRNLGGRVSNGDLSSKSALEWGVDLLKVCGDL